MSTSVPLRLGMVGCGGISHAHGNAAKKAPRTARFAACCDVREDAARNWAAQYGCERSYTDYEEMIRKESLDGLYLATWPNQHREQVERCLAAGARNILCEKALTLTGQEAVAIWEMVAARNAFLMEGFMYRHHPAIRKIERLLASGELGPADNVRAAFSAFDPEHESPTDPNRNWRQRRECGGGVPYDFACYAVNACGRFAGGLPVRAFALGTLGKYETLSRLHGIIEYANGCVGIIESSKRTSFSQELQVSCADGILNLPIAWTIPGDVTIRETRSPVWSHPLHSGYAVAAADSYQLQLENFADVIRGQGTPVLPLVQSVVNTFVLEALVSSALEKRAVEIELPTGIRQAFVVESAFTKLVPAR